jgi:integral membrane protein
MAIVVGIGLATLCFVGIPLQLVGHGKWPWTSVVEIVGPVHGICYLIYLTCCLDLAGRARFRTVQLLGMACAGLLPLLAFYMERKVVQRVNAQLALGDDAPPGPAADLWAFFVGRRSGPVTRREPRALDGQAQPTAGGAPVGAAASPEELPTSRG